MRRHTWEQMASESSFSGAEPGRCQQENVSFEDSTDSTSQPIHCKAMALSEGRRTRGVSLWWRELENRIILQIVSILYQWSTDHRSQLWGAWGRSGPYPTPGEGLSQQDHKYMNRIHVKLMCPQNKLEARCLFNKKLWVILQVISLILLNSRKTGGHQRDWNGQCSLEARMNFRTDPESWDHTTSLFSQGGPNMHGCAPALSRIV